MRKLTDFVLALFTGLFLVGMSALALLALQRGDEWHAIPAWIRACLFFLAVVPMLGIGGALTLLSFGVPMRWGKSNVRRLLAALNDGDPYKRAVAAMDIGHWLDPQTVEPLIAALEDSHPHVRLMAAISLGDLRDPRAVEPLIALLRDEHPFVRAIAAAMLGRIGDARALQPLVIALDDPSPWSLATAYANMPKLDDAREQKLVIARLDHKRPCVRTAAEVALARIRRLERSRSATARPPTS